MPAQSPLSSAFSAGLAANTLQVYSDSLAWKVVLATQLFFWVGQFVGHGVFEVKHQRSLRSSVAAA